MDPRSDEVFSSEVPLDASFIQADENSPSIIDSTENVSVGMIGAVLRRAARRHSGINEICKIPTGPQCLVQNSFHLSNQCGGSISVWREVKKSKKGWIANYTECGLKMLGRYFALASPRGSEEMELLRSSLRRWEQDCLQENHRANIAEMKLAERDEDISQHIAAANRIREQLVLLEKDYQNANIEILSRVAESTELREAAESLREELSETSAELQRAREEIKRLSRIVSADGAALSDARDEITSLKRKMTDLRHESAAAPPRRAANPQSSTSKPSGPSGPSGPSRLSTLAADVLMFDRSSLRSIVE